MSVSVWWAASISNKCALECEACIMMICYWSHFFIIPVCILWAEAVSGWSWCSVCFLFSVFWPRASPSLFCPLCPLPVSGFSCSSFAPDQSPVPLVSGGLSCHPRSFPQPCNFFSLLLVFNLWTSACEKVICIANVLHLFFSINLVHGSIGWKLQCGEVYHVEECCTNGLSSTSRCSGV